MLRQVAVGGNQLGVQGRVLLIDVDGRGRQNLFDGVLLLQLLKLLVLQLAHHALDAALLHAALLDAVLREGRLRSIVHGILAVAVTREIGRHAVPGVLLRGEAIVGGARTKRGGSGRFGSGSEARQ